MNAIGVFCGSSPGIRSDYADAARRLAGEMARRGLRLVYGGADRGVMAALADAMLSAGGEVVGVIPEALVEREIAHAGLTELRTVRSMHERKATMAELSDGFITLPGGLGTLDEFFEVFTWGQLGLHDKPCGMLNVGGYFDGLLPFLETARDERFVSAATLGELVVEDDVGRLVEGMENRL